MRYVFTISPGRSGQGSLAAVLTKAVPSAFVAFEEPQVVPVLPGVLGDIERRFRRRFVETHELLGRGKVLAAFDRGDDRMLRLYAERRQAWVRGQLKKRGVSLYIDISKHFLHGLHCHTLDLLDGDVGFIRLVRDPIENMCSYVNRRKSYHLDYGRTDSPYNELIMDPETLDLGQMYLHAWCECYLRGAKLIRKYGLPDAAEIMTADLSDSARIGRLLNDLHIAHDDVPSLPPQNTNVNSGYAATAITRQDVESFLRFRDRLSDAQLADLPLLATYDPWAVHPQAAEAS